MGALFAGILLVMALRYTRILACLLAFCSGSALHADGPPRLLLRTYCLECHGPENTKGNIRLDQFSPPYDNNQFALLEEMLDVLIYGEMPPEKNLQPSSKERDALIAWTRSAIAEARSQDVAHHGTVRRLTVSQYRIACVTCLA